MICKKCGKDWSESVYHIHIQRCTETKEKEPEKKDSIVKEEFEKEIDIPRGLITAELDERGIKYDSRKSTKNLLKILNEAKKEAE